MNVMAIAGRRIDADDAEQARFPLAKAPDVRREMTRIMRETETEAVVCSAACGADLIALDVARELDIPAWVVLPFDRERFRQTSVMDRPGDWGQLFDELVDQAEHAGRLDIIAPTDDSNHEAYSLTIDAILDRTMALAHEDNAASVGRITALAVWDGASRGPNDLTAAFLERARQRGISVRQLLT